MRRLQKLSSFFLILLVLTLLLAVFFSQKQQQIQPHPAGTLVIYVSGNHLVTGNGQVIRLIGVNRAEDSFCIHGEFMFDGPFNATEVQAMLNWNINVVRITLNEDCWLGINGVTPSTSGANYQNGVINYINLLHRYGLYTIVDLHWNAPGTNMAKDQQVMADADHALVYWKSVANSFKHDPAVIFDLYNEPHIQITNTSSSNPWACWRDGCTVTVCSNCTATHWQGAGMQALVDAVRSTGATNPIMVSGNDWANNMESFLQYLPSDPQNQLIASFHTYPDTPCNNTACWNNTVLPVAQKMPVVTGEFGEKDCLSSFNNLYMAWADANNISYTAWRWAAYNCNGSDLLRNWDGTPNSYGQTIYNHYRSLKALAPPNTPTPTLTPTPTQVEGNMAVWAFVLNHGRHLLPAAQVFTTVSWAGELTTNGREAERRHTAICEKLDSCDSVKV